MAFHFIRNFRNCENSPFTSSYFQAGAGRSERNSEKVSEGSIGGVAAENPKAAAECGRAIRSEISGWRASLPGKPQEFSGKL